MRTLILALMFITLMSCGSSINNSSNSNNSYLQERIVEEDMWNSQFKTKKDYLYYKNKKFTGIKLAVLTQDRKCWLKIYDRYTNGLLNGESKIVYCSNGQLKRERIYDNGKLLSEKEWNEYGRLTKHDTY